MTNKELFDLRAELVDFSYIVFNYFNGRINIVNKNVVFIPLLINPLFKSVKYAGCTKFGVVELYIENIIKLNYGSPIIFMKMDIIYTIIHELYHCDEYTDLIKYFSDNEYKIEVEQNINYMTTQYLYNNYQDINNIFNVYFNEKYINELIEIYNCKNGEYSRIQLFEYYNSLFCRLYGDNVFYNILQIGNNIKVNICGNIHIIKLLGEFQLPTEQFVIDRYNIASNARIMWSEDGDNGDIIIYVDKDMSEIKTPFIKFINPLIPITK